MFLQFKTRIIDKNNLGSGTLQRVAHRDGRSALLFDEDLLQLLDWPKEGEPSVVYSRRLGLRADSLALSPTQRYVVLRSSDQKRLAVWDSTADRAIGEIASAEGKWNPPGALMMAGSTEMLLTSPERMRLAAYRLEDMSPVFDVDFTKPLALTFTHLYPNLDHGGMFFVVGYLYSESKNSLYSFSLTDLAADRPPDGQYRMKGQREISDYAYRLAAGPCGDDAVVIFRDPDHSESTDENDEPEPDDSGPLADVWGFRGLYVRRLNDCQIVERIGIDVPLENGADLFATDKHVIIACPEYAAIVPRQGIEGEILRIPAHALSLDANNRSLMLITPEGNLQLFELEGN